MRGGSLAAQRLANPGEQPTITRAIALQRANGRANRRGNGGARDAVADE
jgi:hypothetical protein